MSRQSDFVAADAELTTLAAAVAAGLPGVQPGDVGPVGLYVNSELQRITKSHVVSRPWGGTGDRLALVAYLASLAPTE